MQIKKKKVGPHLYFYAEWFFIVCVSSVKSWGKGKKEKETYWTNFKIVSEGKEKSKKLKAGIEINLMNCQQRASSEKL